MAIRLPTAPISIPSALAGQSNGRLSSRILSSTPGQAGGSTVVLLHVATRAWRALCADAKRHGHILKINGSASAYRTYAWQYKVFTERYVTWNTGSGVSVIWNGRRWWKRQGVPVTAKPGTSNHGWGLAVDTGEERDRDAGAESLDSATLAWLIANEHRFGFSHELQSEPWHIRYVAGDNIPAAVRAYEAGTQPKPPAPPAEEEDDDVRYIVKGDKSPKWWITDGLTKRWVDDKAEAGVLAYAGLAKWNNGGPYVWPQDMVNDIKDAGASGGGGAMVIRRKLKPTQSLLFVGGKVFVGHDAASNSHLGIDPDATNIADADEAMWSSVVSAFSGSLITP